MARRGTWVGLVALACADAPPPPPTPSLPPAWVAGSRLVPVVERGQGIDRFVHMFDLQLSINCEFLSDVDHNTRCLPTQVVGSVFFDAGCTEPLMLGDDDDGDDDDDGFVRWQDPEHLERWRALSVGSVITPAMVYGGPDCSSSAWTSPLPLRETSPVPAGMFVRAADELEIIDEQLARRRYATDDGAAVVFTLHDRALGVDCHAQFTPEGVLCMPDGLPTSNATLFTDPGCQTVGAELDTADPVPPPWAHRVSDCGELRDTHEVTGEVMGGFVLDDLGTCVAADPPRRLARLGSTIDWGATFVALSVVPDGTDIQLLRVHQAVSEGGFDPGLDLGLDVGWFDPQIGLACSLVETTHGSRCAPNDALTTAFADPQCAVGLGPSPDLDAYDCDAPSQPSPSGRRTVEGVVTDVYAEPESEVFTGAMYTLDEAACVPLADPPSVPYMRYRARVPATALPALQTLTLSP